MTPFAPIETMADLKAAVEGLGCPAVLKTAGFGYDGKGQLPVAECDHAAAAWDALKRTPCVLESRIDFECELSVV